MSVTAFLSAFLLLTIVLMVESCMKIHEGVHTTHGFPVSDDVTQHKGTGPGRNSGPLPPHPFRRRSVTDEEDDDENTSEKLHNFVTDKLQELFNDIDSDSDGLVTVTEWTRRKAAVTEFDRLLDTFDKDGDKSLSFNEFLEATTYS